MNYETLQPMRTLMLVRRYERPEKVGEIWLPDEARTDKTGILWEFIRGGPDYTDEIGMELTKGDILQAGSTMAATDIGEGFFLLRSGNVQCVHPWVTADE